MLYIKNFFKQELNPIFLFLVNNQLITAVSQSAIPLESGRMYHIRTYANDNEDLIRSKENYM